MAEHCHFISSFSLRIWVHACGGLDGPRAPAHTCSPQRTLGYRRSTLIYISPSQISLYLKKKKPMAALWGGVSSHFRDPRGQLQWWIYPLQSEPPLQRFLVHFWVTYHLLHPVCSHMYHPRGCTGHMNTNEIKMCSIRYLLKFCFHYQSQTRF